MRRREEEEAEEEMEKEEEEEEERLHWPVKYSSNEAGAGREVEMEKSPQESQLHIFSRHMGTAEHRGDTRTKGGEESWECTGARTCADNTGLCPRDRRWAGD